MAKAETDDQRKAAFVILELAEIGIAPSEIIGQMIGSLVQCDMPVEEAISEMAGGLNRAAELITRPEEIWEYLLPGPGRVPEWEVVQYNENREHSVHVDNLQMKKYANIILAYSLNVHTGDDVYHAKQGAEFFMDEHNIQWCKFKPANGGNIGSEHLFRTDRPQGFYITRSA